MTFEQQQQTDSLRQVHVEDARDALFNDCKVKGVGGKASDDCLKQISKLGFPHVDLTGFEQEAPHQNEGFFKDIWHGIKHMFVKDESVGDKLRRDVENQMSPGERKQFDKENEALEKYKQEVRTWGMSTMMPPPAFPEMPKCPMHDVINRRVEQTERAIIGDVRADMSPSDRKRLDQEMADYQRAFKEATTIHNPAGTGEGFKPLPKPGHAILDYYEKINEATDRYMQHH